MAWWRDEQRCCWTNGKDVLTDQDVYSRGSLDEVRVLLYSRNLPPDLCLHLERKMFSRACKEELLRGFGWKRSGGRYGWEKRDGWVSFEFVRWESLESLGKFLCRTQREWHRRDSLKARGDVSLPMPPESLRWEGAGVYMVTKDGVPWHYGTFDWHYGTFDHLVVDHEELLREIGKSLESIYYAGPLSWTFERCTPELRAEYNKFHCDLRAYVEAHKPEREGVLELPAPPEELWWEGRLLKLAADAPLYLTLHPLKMIQPEELLRAYTDATDKLTWGDSDATVRFMGALNAYVLSRGAVSDLTDKMSRDFVERVNRRQAVAARDAMQDWYGGGAAAAGLSGLSYSLGLWNTFVVDRKGLAPSPIDKINEAVHKEGMARASRVEQYVKSWMETNGVIRPKDKAVMLYQDGEFLGIQVTRHSSRTRRFFRWLLRRNKPPKPFLQKNPESLRAAFTEWIERPCTKQEFLNPPWWRRLLR